MGADDFAGFVVFALVMAAFAAFAIYNAAKWGGLFRVGKRGYRSLGEFAREVTRETRLVSEHDAGHSVQLRQLAFSGALASGRRAKIDFFVESAGSSTWDAVRLEVKADETPHLVITQENLFTRIGKALGWTQEIEIGDEDFDRRFLLKTDTPLKASRLLKDLEVRRAIWWLFDHGARDLTVDSGKIVITSHALSFDPPDYGPMLDLLDLIARRLDRKKLSVRVLGGERRALVDDSGRTRCPYCRVLLSGIEDDLVACEKCSTVLHGECWEEHGGCPLLGCGGERPERARVR